MAAESATASSARGERGALRFGPFSMDLRTLELRRGERPVHLQPQPFKVLAALASRPGVLVTREEIRNEVWGCSTFVDFDQSLNFCVKQIRAALGDQADAPRYVETLPRRGYRFIARVESACGGGTRPAATLALFDPPAGPLGARAARAALALGVLLSIAGAAALLGKRVTRAPTGSVPARRVMVAVLPFENLSGDPGQDYVSEGLTEEMITELARLGSERLGVIARTSVNGYRKTTKSAATVGRELAVDYLVEGSVRRAGDRIRITAQLIRALDQTHLWADSYERRVSDVIDLQGELARRIAQSLEGRLVAAVAPVAPAGPANPLAYDAYLKGRYLLGRLRGPDGASGAEAPLASFEQALAADPGFAAAQAGLASAYVALSEQGRLSPGEAFPKARAAAERAIALDAGSAEGHVALAVTRMYFDWDWPGAAAAFARALDLDPGRAATHHAFAAFLSAQGRHDEALRAVARARELDPLSTAVNGDVGWYLYFARRYDDAIAQYRRTLELEPRVSWVRPFLLDAYVRKGAYASARSVGLEAARPIAPPSVLRSMQELEPREAVLAYLDYAIARLQATTPVPAEFLAARLAERGRREEALGWLQKGATMRSRWLVSLLLVEPRFDALRSDPRFEAVVRAVGLAR